MTMLHETFSNYKNMMGENVFSNLVPDYIKSNLNPNLVPDYIKRKLRYPRL